MTRWWWFAKLFGAESWTSRCRQCHARCSIVVPKVFTRATKLWALASCAGLYVAVFGLIAFASGGLQNDLKHPGFLAGVVGAAVFFASLVLALVTDVVQSDVVLTAATICPACGERLPAEFDEDVCPVCGGGLPRDDDAFSPPERFPSSGGV